MNVKPYCLLAAIWLLAVASPPPECDICEDATSSTNQQAASNFGSETGGSMEIGQVFTDCIKSRGGSAHFTLTYDNGISGNGSVTVVAVAREPDGTTIDEYVISNHTPGSDEWGNVDIDDVYSLEIYVNPGATAGSFALTIDEEFEGTFFTANFATTSLTAASGPVPTCSSTEAELLPDAGTTFYAAAGDSVVRDTTINLCLEAQYKEVLMELDYDNGTAGNGSIVVKAIMRAADGTPLNSWCATEHGSSIELKELDIGSYYSLHFYTDPLAAADSFIVTIIEGKEADLTQAFSAKIEADPTLPLSSVQLQAEPMAYHNLLRWSTTSATHIDGYEVQRSADGRRWESRGFVPAAGRHDGGSYSYRDPHTGHTSYTYRLRTLRTDGTYLYSQLVQLDRAVSQPRLFPNPVEDMLQLRYPPEMTAGQPGQVTIFNVNGRRVHESVVSGDASIPVGDLPSGTYSLVLTAAEESTALRFVKR